MEKNTIYGDYEGWIESGFIGKEEAAYLTRVDWRKKRVIETMNIVKNSSHDERDALIKLIKTFI